MAVQTGAYCKMFQHASLLAILNLPINAVSGGGEIPIPTPIFKYKYFKLLWAFNNPFNSVKGIIACHILNISGCHELAYRSEECSKPEQSQPLGILTE